MALPLMALTLSGAAVGSAMSLDQTVASLGARSTSVTRCGSAALTAVPNLSGSSTVSVTVGNLPSACGGATIQVALNNGSAVSTGSSTVPGGGGSVTVNLAGSVAITTNQQIEVLLTGP